MKTVAKRTLVLIVAACILITAFAATTLAEDPAGYQLSEEASVSMTDDAAIAEVTESTPEVTQPEPQDQPAPAENVPEPQATIDEPEATIPEYVPDEPTQEVIDNSGAPEAVTEEDAEAGAAQMSDFAVRVTDPTESTLNVSWDAAPCNTGCYMYYYVYRSSISGGGRVYVGTYTNRSFVDRGLSPSTTYIYWIESNNGFSSTGIGTTLGRQQQCLTVNVKATGSSTMQVTWNDVNGAPYQIYRSTYNGGYAWIGVTNSTVFNDTGLNPGTTYYYRVVACNGLSGYNCAKTIDAPKMTVNVSALGCNQLKLSWNAVGRAPYYIYRSTYSGGGYVYIGSSYTTTFTDSYLQAGVTYYYMVQSCDSVVGYGCGTTQRVTPITVTVTPNTCYGFTIKWTAVPGAKQYVVYRSTSATGPWQGLVTTRSCSTKDTPPMKNCTYYYKVVSDNCAEGIGSGTSTGKPLNLKVKNVCYRYLYLNWSNTGGKPYKVYRSTDGCNYQLISSTSCTYYADYAVRSYTNYYYKVVDCYGQVSTYCINSGYIKYC